MKTMKTMLKSILLIVAGLGLTNLCEAQVANPTNAYGDGINIPMKLVDNINGQNVYAIYSGDINQDGTIDGLDANYVDNDGAVFAFGYNASDINGDGATDGLDANYIDNNGQLFLFKAIPQ